MTFKTPTIHGEFLASRSDRLFAEDCFAAIH